MNEKISSYLYSVIPKRISKAKRQKLFDELSCHIEEKAAGFEELGYTEEESLSKAFEAFAETDETKKIIFDKFDEMYHERTWWAIASAAGIFLINILCLVPLQIFVWFSPDYFNRPTIFSAAVSFALICLIVFFAMHLRKKGYKKTLCGLAIGLAITSVSFYENYIFQSASYTIAVVAVKISQALFDGSFGFSDEVFRYTCILCAIIEYVLSSSLLLFCLFSAFRRRHSRKKEAKVTLLIAAFAVVSVAFTALLPWATGVSSKSKAADGCDKAVADNFEIINRSELL